MRLKANKTLFSVTVLLLMLTLLVGCQLVIAPAATTSATITDNETLTASDTTLVEDTPATAEMTTAPRVDQAESTEPSTSQGNVEIASYALTDGSGATLRGVIGLPKDSKRPLVLLLHGRHLENAEDKKPYYEGLTYLVEALTQNGFAAISIDLSAAYLADDEKEIETAISLVNAHLEAVEKAVKGERLFPLDLIDKVDATRLSFVGHSRGGGMAPLLANYYESQNRTVTANVLLAPTTYIGVLSEDGSSVIGTSDYEVSGLNLSIKASVGQPTAVLMAQHDGDVSDQPGYSYFLNAIQQSKPDVPVLTTWLHQANHAGFNTLLAGKHDPIQYPGAIIAPPEKIQAFVQRYVVDVLTLGLLGKDELATRFRSDAFKDYPLPSAMTVYDPKSISLLAPLSPALDGFHAKGMEATYIQSSSDLNAPKYDSPLLIPGFDGSVSSYVPLTHLSWKKAEAMISLDFTNKDALKGGKGMLALYWALDATSPLSQQAPLQFEVRIEDAKGQRTSMRLNSDKDLSIWFEKGEMTVDPIGREVYSHATPLLTELVSSEMNQQINFENLARLEIVGLSSQGALALYDVRWLPLP